MNIFPIWTLRTAVSCCPFGLKRQTDIENVKHNHVNNPIKVFIFMPFVQHFKQQRSIAMPYIFCTAVLISQLYRNCHSEILTKLCFLYLNGNEISWLTKFELFVFKLGRLVQAIVFWNNKFEVHNSNYNFINSDECK